MKQLIRFTVMILSFVVLISAAVSIAAKPPEDRWHYGASGYERALELQRELNIPLVVYFYTDWCPYCRELDNQYLSAAPVQQYLRSVVKVRINPEHGPAERSIAVRYGVRGFPTFLIMHNASSAPRDVQPFRRGGANLTLDQFVAACQRASSFTPQPANASVIEGSRLNAADRIVMGATRQTKGLQMVQVSPASASSRNLTSNAPLPSLDAVLAKYLEAIGGRDAHMRLTSRITKARVDVDGLSYGGRLELYAKAPNKALTVMNAEPMGLVKQGFDGRNGWSISDKSGLQNLNGAELAALAMDADFYRDIRLKELYGRIKVISKVKDGFREVYIVEAVPRVGVAEILYFDVASGLLTRRDVTRRTSAGSVRTQIQFSDWRDVDGVKLPFKMTQLMPDHKLVFTFEDIKHNVPVDETIFQRPVR